MKNRNVAIAAILGNCLELYDYILFGYLANIIATQFFPSSDPKASLLMTYGIFAAGIFEETGRLLAFLITKRHYKDIDSAVSYGVGHGGIEAAAVVGLGMLNGVILAVMINSGT